MDLEGISTNDLALASHAPMSWPMLRRLSAERVAVAALAQDQAGFAAARLLVRFGLVKLDNPASLTACFVLTGEGWRALSSAGHP